MQYADINKAEVIAANYKNIKRILLKSHPAVINRDYVRALQQEIFAGVELTKFIPGIFRKKALPGALNISCRMLSAEDRGIYSMRSFMDAEALLLFDRALAALSPEKLKPLNTAEVIQTLSAAYARLDYTHPFIDGNSRTFRTLLRQAAQAAGFNLNWGKISASPYLRDDLYCARSLAVNALALKDPDQRPFTESIENMLAELKDKRTLTELLAGEKLVTPFRASAFKDKVQQCFDLAGNNAQAFKDCFMQSSGELITAYPELSVPLAQLLQALHETIKGPQDVHGYAAAAHLLLPAFYSFLTQGKVNLSAEQVRAALREEMRARQQAPRPEPA